MSSDGIDLSAYPVIRIDQIPYAQTDILRDAVSEVKELVASMMSAKGPKPPLLSYLRRQLEGMHAELVDRGAKDRITKLLSCADGFGLQESNIVDFPNGEHQSTNEVKNIVSSLSSNNSAPEIEKSVSSVSEISDSCNVQQSVYNRIPLPSELKRQESLKHEELHAVNSKISLDSNSVTCLRTANSALSNDLSRTSKNAVQTTKSHGVADDDASSPSSRSDCVGEETTKAVTASNSRKSSRRSSAISNNNPAVGSPSKKATAALYKDFGTQFLVAATEKKLRFHTKKIVLETEEEIRERSKGDRSVNSILCDSTLS